MDREYASSDLAEAAYAAAKGETLLRVEVCGDRSWFVFSGDPATVRRYHVPGENFVEAKAFHAALRDLRGLARRGGR